MLSPFCRMIQPRCRTPRRFPEIAAVGRQVAAVSLTCPQEIGTWIPAFPSARSVGPRPFSKAGLMARKTSEALDGPDQTPLARAYPNDQTDRPGFAASKGPHQNPIREATNVKNCPLFTTLRYGFIGDVRLTLQVFSRCALRPTLRLWSDL